MSLFYNPQRRRNLFSVNSTEPYKVSRSGLELFLNCPRCFYLDKRLGIARPDGPPFNLNKAVDKLLKKEFDIHRAKGTRHPLMKAYKIDAVPAQHQDIDKWRDVPGRGIDYYHKETNLIIYGGVDDVWIDKKGQFIIVDYKATVKNGEVNIDSDWQMSYKRQIEIYQWLFRQNGFKVSDTGYFVYCNGNTDKEAFDGKLEFDIKIIPYTGNDNWVEETIIEAHKCLSENKLPRGTEDCDFCRYRDAVGQYERV